MVAESVPILNRIGHRFIRVPGSKSISIRAMMLGGLGAGRTVLEKPLVADDTELFSEALKAIGVGIKWNSNKIILHGVDGNPPHGASVNLGAGGTPSRFMIAAGALAAQPVTVDGNHHMRQRPIRELLDLLKMLGASIEQEAMPIRIDGSRMKGGVLDVPITKSSQLISALLLIAPFIDGGLVLRCKKPVTSLPYIYLTLDVLCLFNVHPRVKDDSEILIIEVPQTRVTHKEFMIEPDASSAIYFASIAALHEGMKVTLEGLPLNSIQPDMEAIRLLASIGAEVLDSPAGTTVRGTGKVQGFGNIDASGFPDASLALAAVAAFGDSPSRFYGLETLPIKESNRIDIMAKSLAMSGCGVSADDSELRITPIQKGICPIAIDPMNDHRIAMSMAIIGTKRGNVSIVNPSCVTKSYPTFWQDLRKIYEGANEI